MLAQIIGGHHQHCRGSVDHTSDLPFRGQSKDPIGVQSECGVPALVGMPGKAYRKRAQSSRFGQEQLSPRESFVQPKYLAQSRTSIRFPGPSGARRKGFRPEPCPVEFLPRHRLCTRGAASSGQAAIIGHDNELRRGRGFRPGVCHNRLVGPKAARCNLDPHAGPGGRERSGSSPSKKTRKTAARRFRSRHFRKDRKPCRVRWNLSSGTLGRLAR